LNDATWASRPDEATGHSYWGSLTLA
jgi:hypothetical protein